MKRNDKNAITVRFPDNEIWLMHCLEKEAVAKRRAKASMLRVILAERYQNEEVDPEVGE